MSMAKREKIPCVIVTFHTTAEAMATEKLCKKMQLDGKLISAPRSLSPDCGIAWCSPAEYRHALEFMLMKARIETAGFFEEDVAL